MARDWQLSVDLANRLVFPVEILVTSLRPDILIHSPSKKLLVVIELTVPWEERIEEAHERKKAKYSELVNNCSEKGWRVWCFPVEIGTRGFPGKSTSYALSQLGMRFKEKRAALKDVGEQAERCSTWLWLSRKNINWGSQNLGSAS